jgi:holo-[acyl-carrier protein] synthase
MIPATEDGMTGSSGLSVGIDVVSIARIEMMLGRWGDRFLRRVFTEGEIEYCLGRSHPAPSLAARFAAKEAFFKAVSHSTQAAIGFKSIEVMMTEGGAPALTAHGAAGRALGDRSAAVSLSHDRDMAIAIVITSPEGRP